MLKLPSFSNTLENKEKMKLQGLEDEIRFTFILKLVI